jgi:CubicO group peptidase (beta-lactamase class C family)
LETLNTVALGPTISLIMSRTSATLKVLSVLGMLAVACRAIPIDAMENGKTPTDIGGLLEPIIARAQIPGMAALVLRGHRIVAQGVAGVRKQGASEPITLGDQFEIGSCAKAMTATLAAILIDEGNLSWDTTVTEVFGDTAGKIDPAWAPVSLRLLLEHRAGLTGEHYFSLAASILSANANLPLERRRYAAKLLSRPPDITPDTKFIYINADYILGAAMREENARLKRVVADQALNIHVLKEVNAKKW